jgi:hypothetical protein
LIGGCLDPRASLDNIKKWQFLPLPGLELLLLSSFSPYPVAIWLHWAHNKLKITYLSISVIACNFLLLIILGNVHTIYRFVATVH